MNANFNKEEFRMMIDKAYQFGVNRPSGMTRDEYCQQYIIDQLPNVSQSEAQEIFEKIKLGIGTFNQGIDTFGTENGFDNEAAIESLLQGKNQQECFNGLVNILLVAKVANIDSTELYSLTDEKLEYLRRQIISNREVTEASIEEMKKEVATAMENMNIIGVDIPMKIEYIAKDATELRQFLADSDNTLYIATLTYVDSRNGKIKYFEDTTPENIGMAVAAGIHEAEITAKLEDGTIDLPTWAKWTKIIGGVLLWGALLLGGVLLATFGILPICLLIFNWLGTGIFATIITLALAFYGAYESSEFIQKYLIEPILDKTSDLYDKLIQWIEKKRQEYLNKSAETQPTDSSIVTATPRTIETEGAIQPQMVQI